MSLPPNYRKDTISSLQKQVKRKSSATTSLHTFSAPPSRQANYPPGDDTSFDHSFEHSFSRSVSRSLNRSFDHSFDRSLNLSPEPIATPMPEIDTPEHHGDEEGSNEMHLAPTQELPKEELAPAATEEPQAHTTVEEAPHDPAPPHQEPENLGGESTPQRVGTPSGDQPHAEETITEPTSSEGTPNPVNVPSVPTIPKVEIAMPPLPPLPGLPIIQKISGPEKLESPKTPVDRINAIWNKWLNMYVSDSQYVEAAVNHYDTNYREIPDLVISTHDSDFKATWSIIYQGYPGADNNNTNTGPMDWKPIEKHMKHLCTRRNSGETPIFAIAAFGRWVRLYAFGAGVLIPFNFTLITPLAPPLILVVPNEVPNDTQANTYTSLDVGNDLHVLFIMFYLNVAIRTGGAFPEKPKSDTAPASNAGPTTKTD
ncbi:hypothetical protein BDV93DRAFT_548304 [Ceratobasidium sp. AG-I]|nr:hypothetical protein BDV93DRAFT_548304 [Ceratobasidium sp. AG-I]